MGINKLFHKIGHDTKNLFTKGTIGNTKIFGKGSVGSKFLGDVSKGFNTAAGVLHHGTDTLNKVAFNPALQGVLASAGPTGALLGRGLAGAGVITNTLANAAEKASALTKQRNYDRKPNALELPHAVPIPDPPTVSYH